MTPFSPTTILEAAGWLAGAFGMWKVPGCPPAPDPPGPDLAVIIPARNEAARLPGLLASLPAGVEVIVVDDHSSDGTAALARAGGARVIPAPELPGGWTGKCWACWTGARATGAQVLVFLDADTALEPGGLGRLVAASSRAGGLLSVQPFHLTVRPYEALSAFPNLVSLLAVGACTPLGDRLPPGGAFGPCLVCRRADYLAAGGHQAVRGEVVEDVALARLFRARGLPVRVRGGRGTIRFRMYPEGPRSLVEGWTKNLAAGAASTRPAWVAVVFLWITALLLGAIGLVLPAASGGRWASTVVYVALAGEVAWMLRRVGRFPWWAAVAYPVPLAAFLALLGRSALARVLRRPVSWRGRPVPPAA